MFSYLLIVCKNSYLLWGISEIFKWSFIWDFFCSYEMRIYWLLASAVQLINIFISLEACIESVITYSEFCQAPKVLMSILMAKCLLNGNQLYFHREQKPTQKLIKTSMIASIVFSFYVTCTVHWLPGWKQGLYLMS